MTTERFSEASPSPASALPSPLHSALDVAAYGCACAAHGGADSGTVSGRRRFLSRFVALGAATGAGLASSAVWAQAGNTKPAAWEECKRSGFTQVVSGQQMERAAAQQYAQMMAEARSKSALAPRDHPKLQRLHTVARRLIPTTTRCNPTAQRWQWEVNLIGSDQVNAFCMPGGKIAFFSGIIDRLALTDDEIAMVMGHEMAHALLEHASEQAGKGMVTQGALEIGAALFGLGDLGRVVSGLGTQLLSLRFSRNDEREADALGLVMGAQAGYDPRAAITLWQKMAAASKGAPPQWLSTHPSSTTRIRDLEARMPRALSLYRGPTAPGAASRPDSWS